MLRFGMGELVVIFLIIVVLFGAKRLPEIGRALGKALREFKKADKDITGDAGGDTTDSTHAHDR